MPLTSTGWKSVLTEEQQTKLKKAEDLLGDVQVELAQADAKLPKDQRTENWRQLYHIRVELGQEVYRLNGGKNIL